MAHLIITVEVDTDPTITDPFELAGYLLDPCADDPIPTLQAAAWVAPSETPSPASDDDYTSVCGNHACPWCRPAVILSEGPLTPGERRARVERGFRP